MEAAADRVQQQLALGLGLDDAPAPAEVAAAAAPDDVDLVDGGEPGVDEPECGKLYAAASRGDAHEVERLLAAGAPAAHVPAALLEAAMQGHAGAVRALLRAEPGEEAFDAGNGWTVLHHVLCDTTRETFSAEVVEALLAAAPHLASQPLLFGEMPLLLAALSGYPAAVRLLLAAAPDTLDEPNMDGDVALRCAVDAAYFPGPDAGAELRRDAIECARLLVDAAPAAQPSLGALLAAMGEWADHRDEVADALLARLAARLPLSKEDWASIPAPCPQLASVLPAVLQRSAAEAGWLVGRLAAEQQDRLRTTALLLGRATQQSEGGATMPRELAHRILAQCLLDA